MIDYQFGLESFQRHYESGRKAGVTPVIIDSPTIALDIDYPEDLDLVWEGVIRLLSGE
jgi:2-phospho-L-lactate guanylyltransferase (CobY/MobA/RfbA family)